MFKKEVILMDKLNWLKQRQKGIGGSDVGAILGLNKYKSAFQVYLDKTEEITADFLMHLRWITPIK